MPIEEKATIDEIARARDEYQREGEIEIDDAALVSHADDNPDHGCYVAAWVWVADPETDDEET